MGSGLLLTLTKSKGVATDEQFEGWYNGKGKLIGIFEYLRFNFELIIDFYAFYF